MRLRSLLFSALLLIVSLPLMADPVSVSFTSTQIGGSEWRYNYSLSGSFGLGDDLAIYFPLASSAGLSDLGTGGADWTTFVFQPDPMLPADGEFDMVANVTSPDISPVFSVDYSYSGPGTPGGQSFTLYDANFNILEQGVTTSAVPLPVPEPSSLLLIGSGLSALWVKKRRYS